MKIEPDVINDLREACAGLPRAGGPSSFVRMFKPRFAKLVKAGRKLQTIRPLPKRIPRCGDHLSLRRWLGKPYRSRQRILRKATVSRIEVCRIEKEGIFAPPGDGSLLAVLGVKYIYYNGTSADRFARADGFKDWQEMREWFKAEHGLPFDGVIIFWINTAPVKSQMSND